MPCSGARFLVIEDHAFQRKMLCQMLANLGSATTLGVASAREGLQELQQDESAFDLVILDLMMEGMDGMEFMRHLGTVAPGVPVLVSSACDSALLGSVAQVAEAYGVRLLGAVQKPVTPAKLVPVLAGLGTPPSPAASLAARFSLREIADGWSRDEFQALFEPKVDLTTGTVTSMDVTPAWQHPSLGLLSASHFMPCIEARGLADEFALLLLEKGMARCRKWHERGLGLVISAEMPADCLLQPKLVDRLHVLASREEVRPDWVMLQVQAPDAGSFPALALENLARLRMRGFGVGMAVQQVGAATAESLAQAPFTELRIRRAAFSGALRSGAARTRLTRCLGEARQRKVRTVGAGLANKDEWALLHGSGCDMAQGPFVSEPLAGRAVAGWIQARAAATIR